MTSRQTCGAPGTGRIRRQCRRLTESKTLVDGGDLRERGKALETDSKHYATKADLANVKVWTVIGVAGALLSVCIALGVALVRLFFGN